MNRDFAVFLHAQRRYRKLSQVELARRAQVSERTLRNWETGASSPGRWELESILTALELTPHERGQALKFLPTPRSMNLFRHEAHTSLGSETDIGPMPMLGDLLRAMRLRAGLSQGEVAETLKIARTTILRWETTEILPSEENLERICELLRAYPEERIALGGRRLQIRAGASHFSIEECAEQIDALHRDVNALQIPLIDLRALTLKQQLWPLACQSWEALRLFARLQVVHSVWLMLNERKKEAEICLEHSFHILSAHPGSEPFRQWAVNYAAQCADQNRGGNTASLRVIKRWLPIFPREMQTPLWCDMAFYAGRAHKTEEAMAYLDLAREALPSSLELQKMTEHYYPMTYSRVLTSTGRPVEALDWLPPLPDESTPAIWRLANQYMWTEALLAAGEKDTAQRYLDDMKRQIEEHPLPRFQQKWEALCARF
ncbi:MAG: Helix-turn-helix protein [Chthonomonadaceae bacterium]|nr:Helix-turn-helix protein [Chthonomonadaceae bacterium]